MSTTKIPLSPEEVDIIIESLRSWGASNWRAIDKAFATEAHVLCDRLVAERRERRAHAEALADGDCPDDIVLCDVCGYDIDGDDPAFACDCSPNVTGRWHTSGGGVSYEEWDCPNDIDLDVGSEHPER
jgi:hypothetical protein